jgi:hypothetical protein
MPRALPALFPAGISGSAGFRQHLIMVDTDDPRAAPPRGAPFRGEAPSRSAPRKKKFRLRENFRFRFRIRSMQRQDALLREIF